MYVWFCNNNNIITNITQCFCSKTTIKDKKIIKLSWFLYKFIIEITLLTAFTQLELATAIVVVYQTDWTFFLFFSMISVADIAFY